MATFRIHEDIEKENSDYTAPLRAKDGKPARQFSERCSNVEANPKNRQAFTKATVVESVIQKSTTIFTEVTNKNVFENLGKVNYKLAEPVLKVTAGQQTKQQEQPTQCSVKNQNFMVFEDHNTLADKNLTKPELLKVDDDNNSSATSLSGAISQRVPFQVLEKDEDQDMSISCAGESISPMSVDHSTIKDMLVAPTVNTASILTTPDIAKTNSEKLFQVLEYRSDILNYLKENEKKYSPKMGYMRKQPDISEVMRTILVDWLVEVSGEYRLHNETLFLAINYIDRFLSYMSVVRAKLQLVGTAAMFIAAKYEEIYPPDVNEFVYITDNTYSKKQVLRMEQLILKVLSFDLASPTPIMFINIVDVPDKVKHLAMYFSELALLESDPYLGFVSSMIASGAIALANYTLKFPMWSDLLVEQTGYELKDLKHIVCCLSRSHSIAEDREQQAIQEKYKSKNYSQVSAIPVPDVLVDNDVFESESAKVRKPRSVREELLDSDCNESVKQFFSSKMFI